MKVLQSVYKLILNILKVITIITLALMTITVFYSVIARFILNNSLDNAFEAVSNAMKYARCKHIQIEINVMNKMLRCSISDDGVGCSKIVDGMGLSGMRRRIRGAGGTISFEAEAGFRVNMLLPS